MQTERLVRISLWVTAPLNLVVAATLAYPASSLGELLHLPQQAHPFYTIFTGVFVGLFGIVYFWLALQKRIDRPLLFVGACGKSLAVLISLSLFLQSELSGVTASLMSGDLVFSGLWFYWLYRSR